MRELGEKKKNNETIIAGMVIHQSNLECFRIVPIIVKMDAKPNHTEPSKQTQKRDCPSLNLALNRNRLTKRIKIKIV
jgi:hypothetical protein